MHKIKSLVVFSRILCPPGNQLWRNYATSERKKKGRRHKNTHTYYICNIECTCEKESNNSTFSPSRVRCFSMFHTCFSFKKIKKSRDRDLLHIFKDIKKELREWRRRAFFVVIVVVTLLYYYYFFLEVYNYYIFSNRDITFKKVYTWKSLNKKR